MYNGTTWTYQSRSVSLASFGITVTGTVLLNDIITINDVKGIQGTLCTIKPTKFTSTGLNLFNKSTMILHNYTINMNGVITAASGAYVAFCKAPFSDYEGYVIYDPNSSIIRVGYLDTVPEPGKIVDTSNVSLDGTFSLCEVPETSVNNNVGYICVACTVIDELCIHPRWSGANDRITEPYNVTTIDIPTTDVFGSNLPYTYYGLPSIGSIADEINFDLKQYIQRIEYLPYSAANLELVKSYGVDYDYDSSIIFYVSTDPRRIDLNEEITGEYEVNDYGIEYFDYAIVSGEYNNNLIYTSHLYGENLRDKLRRDVVTISAQTLTTAEQAQVRSNIGAASADDITDITSSLNNKIDKAATYTAGNFVSYDNDGNVISTAYSNGSFLNKPSEITANNFLTLNESGETVITEYNSDSFAAAVHSQAADYITPGTFAGKVVANESAVSVLANAQVRNIYAGTTDMTDGESVLATGDIYIVY